MKVLPKRILSGLLAAATLLTALVAVLPTLPGKAAGNESFTLWEYIPTEGTWEVLTNADNMALAPNVRLDGGLLKVEGAKKNTGTGTDPNGNYPAGQNNVGVLLTPAASDPYMGDPSLAYWRTDPALMSAMSLNIQSHMVVNASAWNMTGYYLYNPGSSDPVFGTAGADSYYPGTAKYVNHNVYTENDNTGYGWSIDVPYALDPLNNAAQGGVKTGDAGTWNGSLLLSYNDRNDADWSGRYFDNYQYDGFRITTTRNVIVDDSEAFVISVAGRKQNATGVGYALAGESVTLSLREDVAVYNMEVTVNGTRIEDLAYSEETGAWTFRMPDEGIVHIRGDKSSSSRDSFTLWQYVPYVDTLTTWGNVAPGTDYDGWASLGGYPVVRAWTNESAADFKQADTGYYSDEADVSFWRQNQDLFEGMEVSLVSQFGSYDVAENRPAHVGFALVDQAWAYNVVDGTLDPARAHSAMQTAYAEPGGTVTLPLSDKKGTWNGMLSMWFGQGRKVNDGAVILPAGHKIVTEKDVVVDASGLLNLTTSRKENARGVAYAFAGETVTVSMADGKKLAGIQASCNGENVPLDSDDGVTYTFTMPEGIVRFQVTEEKAETYTLWMYRPGADNRVLSSSQGKANHLDYYGTSRLFGNGEHTYYLSTSPSSTSPYADMSVAFWRENAELFEGMDTVFTAEILSGIAGADGLYYEPGLMSFQMIDTSNPGWPADTNTGVLGADSEAVSDMYTLYISPETTAYTIPFTVSADTWSGALLTHMGMGGMDNDGAARQIVNYKVVTDKDVVVDDSGAFILSTIRKQDAENVAYAFEGETVLLKPKDGREIRGVTVTCNGSEIAATQTAEGYAFTMPKGIVHVTADIAADTQETFTLWELSPGMDELAGWGNTTTQALMWYDNFYAATPDGHESGLSIGISPKSVYNDEDVALWRNHAELFAAMDVRMSLDVIHNQDLIADPRSGWLGFQLINRVYSYDTETGEVTGSNLTWPGNTVTGDFSTGAQATALSNVYLGARAGCYEIPLENRTGTWNGMLVGWFGAGGSDNNGFQLLSDGIRITTHKDVVKDDSGALRISTKYKANAENVTYALQGDIVTVSARDGMEVCNIQAACAGKPISLTDNGDGTFSFTMPEGIVHLTADSDHEEETFTLWEHNVNTDDHVVWGNADNTTNDRVGNKIPLDRGVVGGRLSVTGNGGFTSGWSNRLAIDNPYEIDPSLSFWKNNQALFEGMELTLNADIATEEDTVLQMQLDNGLYYDWPINVDRGDYRDDTGIGAPADPIVFLASAGRTRYSFPLTNTQGTWGVPSEVGGLARGGLYVWFGAGGSANRDADVRAAGYSITTTKDVVIDDNDSGLLLTTDRLEDATGVAFAFAGETVTIKAPASHIVKSIAVTCNGQPVSLTEAGSSVWTFIMPSGIVHIRADAAEYYQDVSRQSGVIIDDNNNVLMNGEKGAAYVQAGQTVTVTAPVGQYLRFAEGVCGDQPILFKKQEDGSYTFTMPEGIVHLRFKVSERYDTYTLWASTDGSNAPILWENEESPNDVEVAVIQDDEGESGYKFTFKGDVRPNYTILRYDASFPNDTPFNDWRTKIRLMNAFNNAESAVLRFRAKVDKKSADYGGATDLYLSFSNYETEVWNGQYDVSERAHVELTGDWMTYEIPLSAFQQKIQWNIGNLYMWNWPWADGDEVYITQMEIVTDSMVVTDETESGGHVLFESNYHVETADMTYGRADNEDTVFIKPVADEGYVFSGLTVTCNGREVAFEPTDDGRYSFTMPEGVVRVIASFRPAGADEPIVPPDKVPDTGVPTNPSGLLGALLSAAAVFTALLLRKKGRHRECKMVQ